MTEKNHLVAKDIYKSFKTEDGEKRVIEDLNFEAGPGITGLMAPSGKGKTTLLRMLAGLEVPDSGEIRRGSENIGFVFQENRVLPWRTVRENLRFVQKQRDDERVDEVIRLVRLEGSENAYPDELSGGMKRRLTLAQALVRSPDILFLDEPFTGLDKALIGELTDDIKRIVRDSGICAVAVSHQKEELESLCNRIVTLNELQLDTASII